MTEFGEIVRTIEARVREQLAGWPKEWTGFNWPGYTYEHTLRVRNLSLAMARQLGADERVVELAGLLHDIGKPDGEPHGAAGVVRADPILAELGIDAATRDRVCHIIEYHIACDPAHPIENLCLYDADLIDANFGCIAFTRYITIRAGRGMPVDEIVSSTAEWLGRVDGRQEKLVTDLGRAIFRERFAHMWSFQRQLAEEQGTAPGPAMALTRYIAADARRPSLVRQMQELRDVLENGRRIADLRPTPFLREFVNGLKAEVAGER